MKAIGFQKVDAGVLIRSVDLMRPVTGKAEQKFSFPGGLQESLSRSGPENRLLYKVC